MTTFLSYRGVFLAGILLCICLLTTNPVYASSEERRLSVGFGISSLSLKFPLSQRWVVEGKLGAEKDFVFGGGRVYFNFNPQKKLIFYMGGEYSHVIFDTETLSGKGDILMAFLGGEQMLTERISLYLDAGPAFSVLKEESSSARHKTKNVDTVINIGVNFLLW